jgi:hypothetical protein
MPATTSDEHCWSMQPIHLDLESETTYNRNRITDQFRRGGGRERRGLSRRVLAHRWSPHPTHVE